MPIEFPCPNTPPDCECLPFPIRNFSQEEPDVPVFFAHYNQPPTTGTFFAPGCLGVCESTVSQDDADDCAAAQAFECSYGGAPGPDDGNPTPNALHPPATFRNTVQECMAECPDGNSTTVAVSAGTVVSGTQADADARAHGLACKRAQELRVCFVTPSPLSSITQDEFASIPIVAEGGNGDYEFVVVGGSIPTGMTFDPVGLLSGTPTASGPYSFDITVTDTGGGSSTKTFTIEVTAICDVTDWCVGPGFGTCRLRVKDFNVADWQDPCTGGYLATWDGKFTLAFSIFANPCFAYAAPRPGVVLNPPVGAYIVWSGTEWVIHFQFPAPSTGLVYVALGPATQSSPIGTYTTGFGPSCGGPPTLEIESYMP